MTYKCIVCGKEFETGASIERGNKVYCLDCIGKRDEIIDEFEAAFAEAKLYGKPLPSLDEHLSKHEATIEALKLDPKWLKVLILRRCADRFRTLP